MSRLSVTLSCVLDFRFVCWSATADAIGLSNAGLDTGELTTDAPHNVVNRGVRLTAGTFNLVEIIS